MSILVGLIPAIGWGLMPLLTSKAGGRESNQIVGTGLGAVAVGIIATVVTQTHLSLNFAIYAFICGALWTIGQVGQFVSFNRIGLTVTAPLSSALQLVGNSILGVLFFSQWQGPKHLTIGFGALLLVVIGVVLTSKVDPNKLGAQKGNAVTVKDFMFLLATTIGYWIYSSFPSMPMVQGASSTELFLPEVLGILFGGLVYSILTKNTGVLTQKETWKSALGGLAWGVAGLAYIFSGQMNGTNMAFILTQLSVLISTLGGIVVMHETKTRYELRYTLIGLALLVIGSILTSFAN